MQEDFGGKVNYKGTKGKAHMGMKGTSVHDISMGKAGSGKGNGVEVAGKDDGRGG